MTAPAAAAQGSAQVTRAAPGRLRVAHAIHSGGFYGAERVILDLMPLQAAEPGLEPVLIAILDPGQADNEIARRARALGLRVIPFTAPRGLGPGVLLRYARLLRREGLGLVHSHGYKPTAMHQFSKWLGLHRVPLAATAHGYSKASGGRKAALYRGLDLFLLGRAQAVAAVSGEMEAYLRAHGRGLRPERIDNGIPSAAAVRGSHPLRALLEARGRAGLPVIGAVGRMVPMKNHALLLEAYARLGRDAACTVVVIGDGPLRPELEAQARRGAPDGGILLPAFQPEAMEWMADFDIFALPSRDGEGLPMALLEAGLLSKAACCARSGGVPEVIRHGEDGWLFPLEDLAGLEAGLRALLADPGLRARLGAGLRRTVTARYGIERTHRAYRELYARISAAR